MATIASYFGYSVEAGPDAGADETLATILHGLKPIFAAVLAIAVGEVVGWFMRRRGVRPGGEGRTPAPGE